MDNCLFASQSRQLAHTGSRQFRRQGNRNVHQENKRIEASSRRFRAIFEEPQYRQGRREQPRKIVSEYLCCNVDMAPALVCTGVSPALALKQLQPRPFEPILPAQRQLGRFLSALFFRAFLVAPSRQRGRGPGWKSCSS